MKYNLCIVTRFPWSGEFLQKQFKYFFGDLFKITCHSPNETPVVPIFNADLILLHEPSVLVDMQKFIKCDSPVILMRRTITSKALQKLKRVPANSSAVVVNVTDYMAHETMTNIYQLGIKNVELIPWAPDSHRDFPNVDYIFTHRLYDFLPDTETEKVILGSRVIMADVIMDILSYFNVEMSIIEDVFNRYMSVAPSYLKGVHSLLENNRFLSAQWDLLYDKIKQAVAVISADDHLMSYNSHFSKLIHPLVGEHMPLEDVIEYIPQLSIIREVEETEEEIIEVNGQKHILSIDYLDSKKHAFGRIIRLEPYSQIVSVHQNVHKRIIGEGHIAKYRFNDIMGESGDILRLKKLGAKFAKVDLPVLIYGESGTGKELFASAIHNESNRCNAPFVAVNCAGIPDALLESEFFGYEGSAFTGAKKSGSVGLFEKAHGGTLFLDEISEMPYSLQGKLLRAIQEKEIRKVGSTQSISIDVRIIAASNRNIENMVAEGGFRSDLYFRLNVFSLMLPPLKDRQGDVKILCDHILNEKGLKASKMFYQFIKHYDWPGNIRELRNVIDYMSVVCEDDIDIACLPDYIKDKDILEISYGQKSQTVKNQFVLKAINECKHIGESTGRRNLSAYISRNYFKISEADVRKILSLLEDGGYIHVNRGRAGCELTDQGLEYLKVVQSEESEN